MSYKCLARKYRPSSFAELIGHDTLVQTLSNGITLEQLADAILLAGTRGVGKTTIARIIAKSLNCLKETKSTIDICNQCYQCQSISAGYNQDVLEIDAASNTGVQDVREIIENAKYKPVSSRYKVYILDEAHMLSNSAFNALLKTLEEPPSHVKFILATTEMRKIPLTILSRCQKYNLKKIDNETLTTHYQNILQKENIEFEKKAVQKIADIADGSVRDGLSILNQVIVRANSKITLNIVHDIIGFNEENLVLEIITQVIQGNLYNSLKFARLSYENGNEPHHILQMMLKIIHEMISVKSSRVGTNSEQNNDCHDNDFNNLSDKVEMPFLLRAWQVIITTLDELKNSFSSLASLEVAIVKLAHLIIYQSPEELVQTLAKDTINQKNDQQKRLPIQDSLSNLINDARDLNKINSLFFDEKDLVFIEVKKLLHRVSQHGDIILYRLLSGDIGIVNINIEQRLLTIDQKNISNKELQYIAKSLEKIYANSWQIICSNKIVPSILSLEQKRKEIELQSVIDDPFVQSALTSLADYKPKISEIITKNKEIIKIH